MTYRNFISSVQREFAKERMALADYIRKDMLFGMFLDMLLFERTAAQGRDIDFTQKGEVGEVGCTKWVVRQVKRDSNLRNERSSH